MLIIFPPRATAVRFARLFKCTFLMRSGYKVLCRICTFMVFWIPHPLFRHAVSPSSHVPLTFYTICVWCLLARRLVIPILCDWAVCIWPFKFWFYLLHNNATKTLLSREDYREAASVLSADASKQHIFLIKCRWNRQLADGRWTGQQNARLCHMRLLFLSSFLPTDSVSFLKVSTTTAIVSSP